jgi:YaiO family outer membrane protein
MRKYLAILFICFYPVLANSQENQQGPDENYKKALSLANNQQWAEAKTLSQQVLAEAPDYHDARVLLARIYAWEKNYTEARKELKIVLEKEPSHREAIDLSVDVEFWNAQYYDALTNVNQGLYYYNNDKDLIMKKVKILLAMGKEDEAREVLSAYLDAYPNSPEVERKLAQLKKYKNRVAIEYTIDGFDKPYKYRWHMASAQYQREAKWGTYLAKVNTGKAFFKEFTTFNNPDWQIEADAYPILNPNLYVYLNYGYSWGSFFPRHRAGFEPFLTLPKNWEISLGGRYMYYEPNEEMSSDVFILTGSVSKYIKSNWLSFRPYYVFIGNTFSQSYYFHYRHYFKTGYNYLGGALGIGSNPDDPSIKAGDVSRLSLTTYRARLDFQHLIGTRFLFRTFIGFSAEKYFDNKQGKSTFRPRTDATFYIAYLF